MMSMYGSVTDVQVFSRELTDLEMEEMTGCRWVGGSNNSVPFEITIVIFCQNFPHWRHPQLGEWELEPHHSLELLRNGNTGL